MKNKQLKKGMLVLYLLITGITNAQVTEIPPPPPIAPSKVVEDSTKNDIVDFPDVEAQYPGNGIELQRFIQENVQYPKEAMEKGIQGHVYVTFIVEPDGSISDIKVVRGEHESLNNEAMRLVRIMPKWRPTEMNGDRVRARCRLPITFTLGADDEEVPQK